MRRCRPTVSLFASRILQNATEEPQTKNTLNDGHGLCSKKREELARLVRAGYLTAHPPPAALGNSGTASRQRVRGWLNSSPTSKTPNPQPNPRLRSCCCWGRLPLEAE